MDVMVFDNGGKTLDALHIIAADEDIYVSADLAGFSQNSVAQSLMPLPEGIEDIADGCKIAVQNDLDLAGGERFQISR